MASPKKLFIFRCPNSCRTSLNASVLRICDAAVELKCGFIVISLRKNMFGIQEAYYLYDKCCGYREIDIFIRLGVFQKSDEFYPLYIY